MIESIAVISPDTVPLTLKEGNDSLKEKCSFATSLGVRSWKLAEKLSERFSVTLFIPDLNFPGKQNIDLSGVYFDIAEYSYNSSPSFYKELESYDVVLVQSNSQPVFKNCLSLDRKVHLIVDGWTIPQLELPLALIRYPEDERSSYWNNFMSEYKSLIQRSDCILYNAPAHYYYYEALLFQFGKSDWRTIDKSNLIQCTFGMEYNKKINRKRDDILRLLWYGPVYPWYDPKTLIDAVSSLTGVSLDFYAIRHPRFSGYYDEYYKPLFESIKSPNIRYFLDYKERHWELYSQYDAGILLTRNQLVSQFSMNVRTFDMLSYGFPVLSNENHCGIFESLRLEDSLYKIDPYNLEYQLLLYKNSKEDIGVSFKSFNKLQEAFSWDSTTKELMEYLNNL